LARCFDCGSGFGCVFLLKCAAFLSGHASSHPYQRMATDVTDTRRTGWVAGSVVAFDVSAFPLVGMSCLGVVMDAAMGALHGGNQPPVFLAPGRLILFDGFGLLWLCVADSAAQVLGNRRVDGALALVLRLCKS
jgi:hypothetical protein